MQILRRTIIGALLLAGSSAVQAQMGGSGDEGTKADAEQALQSYLAMWSSNDGVTAAAVERFYAPQVIYYGKAFTRARVLADKRAYVHAWPVRAYHEVPGTFQAACKEDRSVCHVSAEMTWRRVSLRQAVSTGRARISFDFVRADGARKIARESAKLLDVSGG